jgi:hypothetical protein
MVQSVQTRLAHRPKTLRAMGAAGVMLLYLATATPLAPAVTVLLAEADCSHHVAVERSASGLQVVLRHDCPSPPTHRHTLIARALTAFARPASPSQPDHVIRFGTLDAARKTAPLALEPPPESPVLDGLPVCDAQPLASRVTVLPAFPTAASCSERAAPSRPLDRPSYLIPPRSGLARWFPARLRAVGSPAFARRVALRPWDFHSLTQTAPKTQSTGCLWN